MTTAMPPVPGAFVRHRAHHWLGLVRPDGDGQWTDGDIVRVHWLARSEGPACRLHRPPDGWFGLDSLRVIS